MRNKELYAILNNLRAQQDAKAGARMRVRQQFHTVFGTFDQQDC